MDEPESAGADPTDTSLNSSRTPGEKETDENRPSSSPAIASSRSAPGKQTPDDRAVAVGSGGSPAKRADGAELGEIQNLPEELATDRRYNLWEDLEDEHGGVALMTIDPDPEPNPLSPGWDAAPINSPAPQAGSSGIDQGEETRGSPDVQILAEETPQPRGRRRHAKVIPEILDHDYSLSDTDEEDYAEVKAILNLFVDYPEECSTQREGRHPRVHLGLFLEGVAHPRECREKTLFENLGMECSMKSPA